MQKSIMAFIGTVEWNKHMGHTIQRTTIVALLWRDKSGNFGTAQPLSECAWCSGLVFQLYDDDRDK